MELEIHDFSRYVTKFCFKTTCYFGPKIMAELPISDRVLGSLLTLAQGVLVQLEAYNAFNEIFQVQRIPMCPHNSLRKK